MARKMIYHILAILSSEKYFLFWFPLNWWIVLGRPISFYSFLKDRAGVSDHIDRFAHHDAIRIRIVGTINPDDFYFVRSKPYQTKTSIIV